jgi:hypothetical protein
LTVISCQPRPSELFAQGKQNDTPELTGCTKDDLGGGVPHPDATVEAFERAANQRYGDMFGAFLKLYPAGSNHKPGNRRTKARAISCVH